MNRCRERDRNGHRCNRRGPHHGHSAFGRGWRTRESLHPGKPRHVTPGWSRKGMTITRAEHRRAVSTPKAAAA